MLRECLDCLTAYAADLEKCPHCLSEAFRWNHEAAPVAAAAPEDPAPAAAPEVPAADEP